MSTTCFSSVVRDTHNRFASTCQHLKDIDSISKRLQDPFVADAGIIFDGFVNLFSLVPTMKDCFGPKADIVKNPVFEANLVKVQEGWK